jgi:hypothetical protein
VRTPPSQFSPTCGNSTQGSQHETKYRNLADVTAYKKIGKHMPSAKCNQSNNKVKQASVIRGYYQPSAGVQINLALSHVQLSDRSQR